MTKSIGDKTVVEIKTHAKKHLTAAQYSKFLKIKGKANMIEFLEKKMGNKKVVKTVKWADMEDESEEDEEKPAKKRKNVDWEEDEEEVVEKKAKKSKPHPKTHTHGDHELKLLTLSGAKKMKAKDLKVWSKGFHKKSKALLLAKITKVKDESVTLEIKNKKTDVKSTAELLSCHEKGKFGVGVHCEPVYYKV